MTEEVRETLHKVSPVLLGAQAPTLVFLTSTFGMFSVETAIDVSKTLVLLLLFSYGLRVGQVLQQNRLMRVVSRLVMMTAGGIVVIIKALFHSPKHGG
jgi:hypothetical protein